MQAKSVLIALFLSLSLTAVAQNTVSLLESDLTWEISKLIIASDYDLLLRSTENPDRGQQALLKMLKKNVSKSISRQTITYYSTDQNGDSVLLSACLYLPAEGDIRQLIVANHYTVCSNNEVPSESLAIEALFCTKGYAVLMADYLGYGISRNRIHPYLHRQTEAQNVLDLILNQMPINQTDDKPDSAAKRKRQTCKKRTAEPLKIANRTLLTDSLILVGYSQGAAVTLALQDLIQNQYANQLHISQTFVGGGPYDPASMYDQWVENDYTSIPAAIPLTILGMDEGENLHLDLSHLFADSLLAHYQDWVVSKDYTLNKIALLMGSNHLTDNMPPSGLDKTDSETQRFYEAMQRQSLLKFVPTTPLYLFHSQDDKWVPFHCSERLAAEIGANPLLTTDFDHYGNHYLAAMQFYKTVLNKL